jgi:hypothetical protein
MIEYFLTGMMLSLGTICWVVAYSLMVGITRGMYARKVLLREGGKTLLLNERDNKDVYGIFWPIYWAGVILQTSMAMLLRILCILVSPVDMLFRFWKKAIDEVEADITHQSSIPEARVRKIHI